MPKPRIYITRIQDFHSKGWTNTQMAEELKCPHITIRRNLKMLGLERNRGVDPFVSNIKNRISRIHRRCKDKGLPSTAFFM